MSTGVSRDGSNILNVLIEKVYDAAVDPSRWSACIEALTAVYGDQVALYVHDLSKRHTVMSSSSLGFVQHTCDPLAIAQYEQHYCKMNVWAENAASQHEGAVWHSDEVLPYNELKRTEFYADFLSKHGYRHCLASYVLKRGTVAVDLAVVRTDKTRRFAAQERELLQRFIPHLRRACEVHLSMAKSRILVQQSFAVFDLVDTGIVLLDGDGRVVFYNQAAGATIQAGGAIRIDRDSRCVAEGATVSVRLQELIRHAAQTSIGLGQHAGGTVIVKRPQPQRPISVLVSPLRLQLPVVDALIAGSEIPRVLLLIRDRNLTNTLPDPGVAQEIFGLTKTEAGIVQQLVLGDPPTEIAKRSSRSIHTVRSHLKQIFRKTGTESQADLVRLVLAEIPLGR